jgi:hypothetical protein
MPVHTHNVTTDSQFSKPRFDHSSSSANIAFGSAAAQLIDQCQMNRNVQCEPVHQEEPYHGYQIHDYLGRFASSSLINEGESLEFAC